MLNDQMVQLMSISWVITQLKDILSITMMVRSRKDSDYIDDR